MIGVSQNKRLTFFALTMHKKRNQNRNDLTTLVFTYRHFDCLIIALRNNRNRFPLACFGVKQVNFVGTVVNYSVISFGVGILHRLPKKVKRGFPAPAACCRILRGLS
jgi:hypothetical protein